MRRALLLGNPGAGLTGVEADIATMTALLGRYAFTDITMLVDGDRAGMLAAIRGLVARTNPGDAAVLYYSGHGWRIEVPMDRRRGGPSDFQGLAPSDLRETTAGDFRGVLADELGLLIDELTEKTANVTVVLDCCYSGGMRGPQDPPKPGVRAVPIPWQIPHAEFVASLRTQGLVPERRDPETNPLAVRLFACRPLEQAGEDPRGPGGLLTRALAAVLADCGHGEVVWEDVVRSVDARVRAVKPGQHPVVVGPARRYLFSLEARTSDGTTACVTRDDACWVVGGALTDIRVGDRFVALPPVSDHHGPPAPALARLEILAVHHQLAHAITDRPLADGATVQPVAWGSPRAAVTVSVDPARAAAVTAAITASGRLAAAASSAVPLIADVVDARGGLEIRDRSGAVVRTAATLDQVCTVLARMAQADSLRRLRSVAPLDPDVHVFGLEWSRVDIPQPLVEGSLVPPDARITASVRNHGPVALYVTLFAAESDGRVSLLTRSQPSGVELSPSGEYRLGDDRLIGVRGAPICGPSLRPGPGPRPVALVALVLEAAVPLGAWETASLHRNTRSAGISLPALFPEFPLRYTVQTLELLVGS